MLFHQNLQKFCLNCEYRELVFLFYVGQDSWELKYSQEWKSSRIYFPTIEEWTLLQCWIERSIRKESYGLLLFGQPVHYFQGIIRAFLWSNLGRTLVVSSLPGNPPPKPLDGEWQTESRPQIVETANVNTSYEHVYSLLFSIATDSCPARTWWRRVLSTVILVLGLLTNHGARRR